MNNMQTALHTEAEATHTTLRPSQSREINMLSSFVVVIVIVVERRRGHVWFSLV
jgi:hypothetical protein